MRLDKARSVLWHGKEFHGRQIGELLDEGKIILSDLTYETEHCPDPKVREATRAIVLHRLQEFERNPNSQKQPLNVITSDKRSYAERRQIQYALLEGTFMGLLLGIGITILFITLVNYSGPQPLSDRSQEFLSTPQGIIALIMVLALYVGGLYLLMRMISLIVDRIDQRIQLHRKGQRGEERVLNAMFLALDSNWWLFRNVEFPGQKQGDIDFVLVSRKGIWAIEAKAYDGEYRTVGDKWERKVGNRWLPTFKNPTRQAKKQATLLSHLLKTHDLSQWVNPAVVWANEESQITIENSSVFIWQLHDIRQELDQLTSQRSISDTKLNDIVAVLTSLHKEPFET